ncbi:MAG TPA: ABC transporter permease [Actinomycetota bacterium]|jgi:branched-chain amino acid transport system permease protein|nr:ABC transporter permease [Actinomycetota bacterium]
MRLRRAGIGVAAFLLGFALIAVGGKVIFPGLGHTTAVPTGLYLQGLVVGILYGLLAIGLVLIYRANRIINFAQGELGAFAATMAAELYQIFHWPYFAAVFVALLATVVSSLVIEFGVIRRFANAPRLILTVATIGVAQILGFLEIGIPLLLNRDVNRQDIRASLASPFRTSFEFGHVLFSGDHIVVLVLSPLILVGLFLFFRYTRYGVAARATAENAERAKLLGVRVARVSLVVWGLAGLLSAVTAILRAPILGFTLGVIGGQGLLLRALAAAVIARMDSLPVTIGASVLLTMAEQTIFFSFGQTGIAEGFLLFVIVLALLLQRRRLGRVDLGASTWRAVQEVRRVPKELRAVPEVRWGRAALVGILGLITVATPFFLSASNTSLASAILIYAMIGISIVMLTGWSGNVSLGHWAFVGVGAMAAGKIASGVAPKDFFLTLLFVGVLGAAAAVLIGLPALRIRGLFLGVTTLAFAIVSYSWFFQLDIMTPAGAIPRPKLLGRIDITSEFAYYYVCLIGLGLTAIAGWNLRRTRTGRNFIALRDNELQAQSLGVRPVRAKLAAFAISGFFAALAGGLYAYHQQALRFDRFPPEFSLALFAMVVIGGMGSMTGAVLGAVYLRGVQFFLPAEYQLLATGVGMLLLLLLFPGGLGQILFGWRDRFLRRVAARHKILVPSLVADRRVEEGILESTVSTPKRKPAKALAGAGRRS